MNVNFLLKLFMVLIVEALLMCLIVPLLKPHPEQLSKAIFSLIGAFAVNCIVVLALAYYKKTKGNWVFVFLFAALLAPFIMFFIYDKALQKRIQLANTNKVSMMAKGNDRI